VASVTFVVAAGALAYTLQQPKVYDARATLAVIPPSEDQALGTVSGATPEQYVDSQLVLLQSSDVAVRAAELANAAVHKNEFAASDFTGPHSSLTLASPSATDPNTSSNIDISFRSHSSAGAAAGANAVLAAYQAARSASVQAAFSSMITAIDATVQQVDTEMVDAGSNGQLAATLGVQRADLLQRRTLAVVDQKVAASESAPAVNAYAPSSAANHNVLRTIVIGAVVGLLLGVLLAYGVESRRRRLDWAAVSIDRPTVGTVDAVHPTGWDAWSTGDDKRRATHLPKEGAVDEKVAESK
jgi:uncharacterized protein involved in exopolysaccharide biosynthesis